MSFPSRVRKFSKNKLLLASAFLAVAISSFFAAFLAPSQGQNPITGFATLQISESGCGDGICSFPETQETCNYDCRTVAGISPLGISGNDVGVSVEFWDSRYESGDPVEIWLRLEPAGIEWNQESGCPFGGAEIGSDDWPTSTVSEDGHFRIDVTCTLPGSLSTGQHSLLARPVIKFDPQVT